MGRDQLDGALSQLLGGERSILMAIGVSHQ